MKFKPGYDLIMVASDDRLCGDGGETEWVLTHNGKTVASFTSCHCGRGCGGRDTVRDDWGYHDCADAIEAARAD